jgi:hypothetical protein
MTVIITADQKLECLKQKVGRSEYAQLTEAIAKAQKYVYFFPQQPSCPRKTQGTTVDEYKQPIPTAKPQRGTESRSSALHQQTTCI